MDAPARPPGCRADRDGQGILTVIVLSLMIVVFIFSTFLWSRTISESQFLRLLIAHETATYLAEAATEEAAHSLGWMVNHKAIPAEWKAMVSDPQNTLYDTLREPNARIVASLRFQPVKTIEWARDACEEAIDGTVEVEIPAGSTSLFDVDNALRDTDTDASSVFETEKRGIFRITSDLELGLRRKRLEVHREFRVVNIGPPPPIDRFLFWILNRSARAPVALEEALKKQGLETVADKYHAIPRGHYPPRSREDVAKWMTWSEVEDSDDFRAVRKWSYTYRGHRVPESFYPHCRYRVSRFFKDFEALRASGMAVGGVLILDGIYFVGGDHEIVLGRPEGIRKIVGRGIIVSHDATIAIHSEDCIPAGSTVSLVVLGENSSIRIVPSGSFYGAMYAPRSRVVPPAGPWTLGGLIYAGDLENPVAGNLPLLAPIEHLSRPSFHVSLSSQLELWRVP